jgi:hypothetical protein
MDAPYQIVPFSLDNLRDLLAAPEQAASAAVAAKGHLAYFHDYLARLEAKTIVAESHYIDRDYLDDFAGYYVRCFRDYPRTCARLHFFAASFRESDFSFLLGNEGTTLTPEHLQEAYLGFVVVKPLPRTVIGRTCLRTYPPEDRRSFPITRDYEAHLFGLKLTVKSLAFQEQDTVAAACATSALCSALNGTGIQFQHHIPSPVEITQAATTHLHSRTRTLPNSGLIAEQMADAIRSVGLEPYEVNAGNDWVLKSTLYAYLRGRIPVLLLVALHEPASGVDEGRHAVTVAGYSLNNVPPVFVPNSRFSLVAFRLDKVYAHDDQIGPFARMEFLQGLNFGTSWFDSATGQKPLQAKPVHVLIPLYSKIRIPFEMVFNIVAVFSVGTIEPLQQQGTPLLPLHLEWDIYLTNVNTLKADLQREASLSGAYRRRILTQPMPRFIWRATALDGGVPALDLLFDATDIEQGSSFVGVIEYNRNMGQILRQALQGVIHLPNASTRPDRHILAWLTDAATVPPP